MNPEPTYPVVRFLARHGVLVSWLCGGVVLVAGVLAIVGGAPAWLIAVAVLAAGVIVVFVRSYVEVVQIIAETLLPR